jgi:hypothetical protein
MFLDDFFALGEPAREEQFPGCGDVFERPGPILGDRGARPNRLLVQEDAFARGPAEDHSTQSAVSDRQGIQVPCLRRPKIP